MDDPEDISLDEPLHAGPVCPDCGASMVFRPTSKYGPFFGCSLYFETGCKGSVKASSDGRMLGTPIDREGRRLRALLMERLAELHLRGDIERDNTEAWFVAHGIWPRGGVGVLSAKDCQKALKAIRAEFPTAFDVLDGPGLI